MVARAKAEIGQLDIYLSHGLRLVAMHVVYGLRRRLEEFGVSVPEWLILRELYRLGASSPKALAVELGIDEGAMSRLVERLDSKFFVARSLAPHGKRHWQLQLTSVGRALVPTLEQLARENDDEFFGYLTAADREHLAAVVGQVCRRQRFRPLALDYRRSG